MQTNLASFVRDTPAGDEAEAILRACVHCGFCTATCPTYQLLGDELDGPRGRIYQIKDFLEGAEPDPSVRLHLDRCLTCRSCETTCPSGVDYHRLLDIGREQLEYRMPRSAAQRLLRWTMVQIMAYPSRFTPLLRIGQSLRPLLPGPLRRKVPPRPAQGRERLAGDRARRVIVTEGCVQPGLAPGINNALEKLLAALEIDVVDTGAAACCGALPHHLSDSERACEMARRNIDTWTPLLDGGAERILITASGCGAHVQDYPKLLADDPDYAARAARVAEKAEDPVVYLANAGLTSLSFAAGDRRVAVHTPCTLQHALGLNGRIENVFRQLGYGLCSVADGHLCCGSAGTYSILQPEMAEALRQRKLDALGADAPDIVVTANIGCLMHLGVTDELPVKHWLEVLADDLRSTAD